MSSLDHQYFYQSINQGDVNQTNGEQKSIYHYVSLRL